MDSSLTKLVISEALQFGQQAGHMFGKDVFVVVIHDHVFKRLLRDLKYLYNIIGVKNKQS